MTTPSACSVAGEAGEAAVLQHTPLPPRHASLRTDKTSPELGSSTFLICQESFSSIDRFHLPTPGGDKREPPPDARFNRRHPSKTRVRANPFVVSDFLIYIFFYPRPQIGNVTPVAGFNRSQKHMAGIN